MRDTSPYSLQKKGFFVANSLKVFFRHPVTHLSILLTVIIFVYFDTISSILRGWVTLQHSHGFLIFAISMYLIWKKRNILTRFPAQPNVLKGLPLTILGCLMFVIGKSGSILLFQEMSLIIAMTGVVWLVLGSTHVRILLLPLSYLFLMFPVFEELLGNLSIYFQFIAAFIASSLLQIAGMPVVWHAQFIELPHTTLEVTKLCNGITHITALVSLAIPISYVTLSTKKSKGIFISLAFLFGIFANGLRIALIGFWTHYFKDSSIHGPFNTLYSSSVYLIEVSILILVAMIMGKGDIKKRIVQGNAETINKTKIAFSQIQPKAVIWGMIVLLITGCYLYFCAPIPVFLKKDLNEFPLLLGSWRGQEVSHLGEDFERMSVDSELKRIYYDEVGSRIHLYVGYFRAQKQNREVINFRYDWLHNNAQTVRILLKPHGFLEIKKTRYYHNEKWKFAFFWYYIDGKIMADRYRTKLQTLINAFVKRKTNAAIVVLSFDGNYSDNADDPENDQIGFLKAVFPILQNYLGDNLKIR